MKLFFLILVLPICFNSFAQNIISGKISDTIGQPITGANITLSKKYQPQILSFTFSDSKGAYSLKCVNSLDSIEINVTVVGYASTKMMILNLPQVLNFILTEKETILPTVVVKPIPIFNKGDTTIYNVSSFSNKQDRLIGDIIAKLPGIEMDGNGQIKYNGKAISNYYIDGLDLLEGKYNIANQSIPYDLVDQIQLIDNHQPIKVLDSFTTPITPALNIKLNDKGKNRLIGKGKVGIGLTPTLLDNELTFLKFKSNVQLISSYKYNNTGLSLTNELNNNISIKQVGNNSEQNTKDDILNTITDFKTSLPLSRTLFNQTHLAYFNILKLFKNTGELKINLSFLNDNTTSTEITNTTFYTSFNTINQRQIQKDNSNLNQLSSNFIYTLNKKQFYIKNTGKVQLSYSKEKSIISDTNNLTQKLSNPFYQYSNDFLLYVPIKKKIYSIASSFNYNEAPQMLEVVPGQFSQVFNSAFPFEKISQYATLDNFNTNNNISFFSRFGKNQLQLKFGSEYVNKVINTSIQKTYLQTKYNLNDSFQNNLNWKNSRIYFVSDITFKEKKKKLILSIPAEFSHVSLLDKIKKYETKISNFFVNPSVVLVLPSSSNFETQLSYNSQSTFGSPAQLTSGLILNSYRNINQYDSLVPKTLQHIYSLSEFYKNPIKAIFGYLTFSYSKSRKNLITKETYYNFYSKAESIEYTNNQFSFQLNTNLTKYFIPIKTNVSLSYSLNAISFPQYLQNNFVTIKSISNNVQLNILISKFKKANFTSNSLFFISKNEISPNSSSPSGKIYRLQQSLKVFYFLFKNFSCFSNMSYYVTRDNELVAKNYLFWDAGAKFSIKKNDIEFQLTNLTNTKYFTSISAKNNVKQIITQEIRPRNFLIKYFFNF